MRKVLLPLLFISSLTVLIIGCEKGVAEPFPPADNKEIALIHFPEGGIGALTTVALDLNPGVSTVNVVELRRESTSPADLQKTIVVKVKLQNAVLGDVASGDIVELPRHLYTAHPDNPFDGEYFYVTFQPGEFVKHLKINIDASTLITAGRVGFGFVIAEAKGAEISDERNQIAVEVSAKNQYDGVYRVRYRIVHPSAPASFPSQGVFDWEFLTSGPNSIDWDFATVFLSNTPGTVTYFGDAAGPSLQVRITVNPANNAVTLSNVGIRAVPLGFPALVPLASNNRYEPTTKTFYTAYGWAGTPNREKYDTLIYLRPR